MKPKVREAIVVEGRYDKAVLCGAVDAIVIETSGFRIFSNDEKLDLLRRLAETRGLILLTDSDGAGFLIRNHLKGRLPGGRVKQAYIPEIAGKERRKRQYSADGLIGVEGMDSEVIIKALLDAGATIENRDAMPAKTERQVTKTDLFADGLSGGENSNQKRSALLKELSLPSRLNANALVDIINALYGYDLYKKAVEKINEW